MAPSIPLFIFCFIIPSYDKQLSVTLVLCSIHIYNNVKGHQQELNSLFFLS